MKYGKTSMASTLLQYLPWLHRMCVLVNKGYILLKYRSLEGSYARTCLKAVIFFQAQVSMKFQLIKSKILKNKDITCLKTLIQLLIVEMPTIVGILTFMKRTNFS